MSSATSFTVTRARDTTDAAMGTPIAAGKPRSRHVIAMLEYMLERGAAYAYELSMVAGVRSNAVYPLLKWWIEQGVVLVTKIGGRNLYSIASRVKKAVEHVLRVILRSRIVVLEALATRIAEARLMRRLKPVERELVALLAARLASTSPYLRIRAENPQNALDILRVKLEERLRRHGLNASKISLQLLSLEETIDELKENGVIYVHWDRRASQLVLRLDRSIEDEVSRILPA